MAIWAEGFAVSEQKVLRAIFAVANCRHTYAAASRLEYQRLWSTESPAFAGDDGDVAVPQWPLGPPRY